MSAVLRIALAQVDFLVGDVPGNVARIVAAAETARDRLGAQLVVFPELSLTGYPPEDLLLHEGLIRNVEKGLAVLAERVRGIDLLVGHPERLHGRLYNTASWWRDGRRLATYHKHELPNYGVFDERRYFVPGHLPAVVEVAGVRVGITICEDLWHPAPMRAAVEAGAELVVNLNASPFHHDKQRLREEMAARRVAETGAPLVYVNLVGGQDELVFDGFSFTLDGAGQVVQRSPGFVEAVEVVDWVRDGGRLMPVPAEIHPIPERTARIYEALKLGLRDYVDKNGFRPGVVLGLSGGIDSALSAVIAVDALGAARVETLMLPSRYTSDMSREDAACLAANLGVAHREISIEPPFRAFLEVLAEELAGYPPDVTEENLQARARGVILMAVSNKKGKMLLTTGNKSELAVGYATLYGDMAGGFAVLKDVPKTWVYRLARWRNAQGTSPVIPERILTRPPSAELAPGQKDEDSLPPYEILDAIIERYVERDLPVDAIVAEGFDEATVHRVARMIDRNEYKRRQAPPGVRITPRAFGKDRRYPITSGYRGLWR